MTALEGLEQELIASDIEAYLARHQQKELLRFVTVGSVDDGKSTLIGRLLHDAHGVYEDQLMAVRRASKQEGAEIDFSLFTDGLRAEREQGITIDVAYRYVATEKRKLIIADTPGHVQYTRNMATGASTADLAIILIDARLGVLQQSRRHAFIASLLGIGQLLVCVNKMDLVAFDQTVFEQIRAEFTGFTDQLSFTNVTFIPVSALAGDNVVTRSERAPWYAGPTLLEHLETVPLPGVSATDPLRFPVQLVLRPNLDYRAFAGQIALGSVRPGDQVMVLPSRQQSRVVAIDTHEGALEEASAPQSVALRLEDEIDISRGDMLVAPTRAPRVGRRFDATLVWMSERPLDLERSYFLKHTTQIVRADVERVEHAVDLETLKPVPAAHLALNDIGRVTIACHRPIYFDAYTHSRKTGAFVLIDALTNNTVAAGMIAEGASAADATGQAGKTALPRSLVGSGERRDRLEQQGAVVWLTGLPAAGKSRLAYALERRLFDLGKVALVVDPEDERGHRGGPRGSSPPHAPELARRLADAGLIAIFAFASPLATDREAIRSHVGSERFFEIHVATPVEVCRARDGRGAYDDVHGPLVYEPPSEPLATVVVGHDDPDAVATELAEQVLGRSV
ncbi:MAG: sulfate adenylyltransferase subunit CysN [Polyangiaceae bacterium]|nr:sulfate adenylyltransferase subunit CysN [Polyangiaceae bacterium]